MAHLPSIPSGHGPTSCPWRFSAGLEESCVRHDSIELAISQTGKTFRYAKLAVEHQRREPLIAGRSELDVVQEQVGQLGHDLDDGHVADKLLGVPRKVEDEV